MKTSINVPDELHHQVQDLAPDIPFGELVRDALLLALPIWQADVKQGPVVMQLQLKLRAVEASAGEHGVSLVRRQRKPRPASPPAEREAPAPATAPARRPRAGKQSATTAQARSAPSGQAGRSRARSPRK